MILRGRRYPCLFQACRSPETDRCGQEVLDQEEKALQIRRPMVKLQVRQLVAQASSVLKVHWV